MAPQTQDFNSNGTNGNDNSGQGTWREWARHVLIELERLTALCEQLTQRIQENKGDIEIKSAAIRTEMENKISAARSETLSQINHNRDSSSKEITELKMEILALKLKASLWGALGAAVPILITLLIALIVHYITKKAGP